MNIPDLVAHRGYSLHYPENTLVGIEAAIRAGARYVEVDIQLSADRIPMLFHDRSLARVCGVSGAIHDFTLTKLSQFYASEFERFGYKFAQEPIATLAGLVALLQRHPQVTAFIEIKRIALEQFGIDVVLEQILSELRPVAERCVLISFSNEFLLAARPRWASIGAVADKWQERKQAIIHNLKPEYLFCDVAGLPRWGDLHYGHSRVVVYEVVDSELALRLAKRGVDLIETFAVGEMSAALELARGAA